MTKTFAIFFIKAYDVDIGGCSTIITDIIDGLKLVADGIESTKTIVEAVKSGKEYLKTFHPEVKNDVLAMIKELEKNLYLIKSTSSVLTNFRFAISADVKGLELVRFNEYFIHSKAEKQLLQNHIDDLRTHCSKIRRHGENISKSAAYTGFKKIFTLLHLNSPEREQRLVEQLNELANEDFKVANSAQLMLDCLETALNNVQNSLGVAGSMHPEKIPDACALLDKYGPQFELMEKQAGDVVEDIRELINDLR